MYIIEHDGIRAEGETEREAKKIMRRLKAAEDRRISEQYRIRAGARNVCHKNGYTLLTRYVNGTPSEVTPDREAGIARIILDEDIFPILSLWTPEGDAKAETNTKSLVIESWILAASGSPLAMLADFGGAGKLHWYVIGAYEGAIYWEQLPDAYRPTPGA